MSVLLSPISVGNLVLSNRIVIPAMHTNLAATDGMVTDTMIAHYRQRARGGAGLVIVEVATVQFPQGRQSWCELQIEQPSCLPGLTRLASTVKAEGAACFLQLFHAGAQTAPQFTGGATPVSPSGVAIRGAATNPRALDLSEINDLINRFVQAGIWAAESGFDGIELHAAHGYLLSEFLSPLTNRRTDIYGGSIKGRCQILIDIIRGIKERCSSLVISVRINGDDFLEGGIRIEEAAAIARELERAGADLLNVSAGMYESGLTSIESNAYPEGWRLDLAAAVKAAVTIPVIGGGVILDPVMAESAVLSGWCDLVYVGRASLADFDWPQKALKGETHTIRPCIRCNTCVAVSFAGGPIRCAVNPEVGGPPDARDPERCQGSYYWLNKGKQLINKKGAHLLIIGSGPAGMTAALLAAEKGYRVTLVEQDFKLGGQLRLASIPPFKKRIAGFRDYLIAEIAKSDVQVISGQRATWQLLTELSPDLIIAALGSRELPLSINDNKVQVVSVAQALTANYQNQRCLVIGGGETGLETAQVLASQGAVVTVVEKAGQLAATMERKNRRSLLNHLRKLPVTMYTQCSLIDVKDGRAILNGPNGEWQIDIDYIIPAYGRKPVAVPPEWLELGIPILVLGDAAAVGTIANATRSAYLALSGIERPVQDMPY